MDFLDCMLSCRFGNFFCNRYFFLLATCFPMDRCSYWHVIWHSHFEHNKKKSDLSFDSVGIAMLVCDSLVFLV